MGTDIPHQVVVGGLRYIGVDLSWKVDPPRLGGTGFCIIEGDSVTDLGVVTTDREILELVDEGEVWVGVDAPLKVPAGQTMRRCEGEVRALGIRILPSERGFHLRHYGGCRGESLSAQLERRGLRYFGHGERAYFEVYPRAVLHAMSTRPARYKRGPAASRRREAEAALRQLREWEPRIQLPRQWLPTLIEGAGAADRLDALLAAVSVYRHRIYSGKRSLVLGDEDDGYILLPPRNRDTDR
jgi:predicted nuclease with RNAse H fold